MEGNSEKLQKKKKKEKSELEVRFQVEEIRDEKFN
jgi:hypothetical protein